MFLNSNFEVERSNMAAPSTEQLAKMLFDFRLSIRRKHFDQTVKILICDLLEVENVERQQTMVDITGDMLFNCLFNRGFVGSIENIQKFRDLLLTALQNKDNNYSQLKGLHQWIEQWILDNNKKQEEPKNTNQKSDSKEKIDLFKEINVQINSKLPITTTIQSNLKNENKLFSSFRRKMKSGKELGDDGCIAHVQKKQIIFIFRNEGYFWHRSQFPSSSEIQKQLIQILNQTNVLEIRVWPIKDTEKNDIDVHNQICQIISLFPNATSVILSQYGRKLNLSKWSINHKLELLQISCSHLEGKLAQAPTTMKLYFHGRNNSIKSDTFDWISTVPNLEISYSYQFQLKLLSHLKSIPNNVVIFHISSVKDLNKLDLSKLSKLIELDIKSIDLAQTTLIVPKSLKKLKLGFYDNGTNFSNQINNFSFVPNLNLAIILDNTNIDIENWWIKKSKIPSSLVSLEIKPSAAPSFFKNLDIFHPIFESPRILLTNLDLSWIPLKNGPPLIFKLPSLRYLNLTRTGISSIPGEISNLKNLEILKLGNNNLTSKSIPTELSELTNLQQLDLQKNFLSSIPDAIFSLINLSKLDLSDNQIETISKEISRLKKLTYLSISENKIKSLPSSFYSLNNLEYLDLSSNQLTEVGSENWNPPLLHLFVQNNKINKLPRITLLNVLTLMAERNPLRYPPKELIHSKYSINKFLEEAPIEIVSKKLIFWGEERAGKTTLMKSLVEGRLLSGKEHEEVLKTIGFQVSKLPSQNGNFISKMWDFAGEIWAIPFHQFFLTKNALYLIVFDLSRKWSQLVKEVSDRINVIVSRSLERVEVLLVGTHAGSKSITYPANLMKQLYDNVRKHFNYDQVSFLEVNGEIGICLELVDLQNPLSSNFFEFQKWLYSYLLDGKFKTSPIYHSFLQKIEDPSFRQIISLKKFLETSGLNRFSQEIRNLYFPLFHKQGHIAYFPEADPPSILLDSRWLSFDFSKLRTEKEENPEFPKTLLLSQSTIEKCLGRTSVEEAIRFFKLFNLCFEPNEFRNKFNEGPREFIFPSLWPKSPNTKISFLKTPNWCVYSIMIKFPDRSPPLGLFHRIIVSFLEKLDLKNLIAWEFGIIQIIDDDCAIGFHDRKENGWLIRFYLQKDRFVKAILEPNANEPNFKLLATILSRSLLELKKCEIQFETKFSCTCNGCCEMKDGDRNWTEIATSQTFWEKLEKRPTEDAKSKLSWFGDEINCQNSGNETAQWQKLCPSILHSVITQYLPKRDNPITNGQHDSGDEEDQNDNELDEIDEMNDSEQEESENDKEESVEIPKQQQGITKSSLRKRKEISFENSNEEIIGEEKPNSKEPTKKKQKKK